jgi:FkbM family methyltransferase
MAASFAWNLFRRLGLKNLANFGESRQRMLGLTDMPIRTVFDIGANKGRRTRAFRRAFPQATVYAIEPIPELCSKLEAWARSQNDRVQVLNVALGSEPAQTSFFVNRRASIWSTLQIPESDNVNDYQAIPVVVDTLDRLAARHDAQDEILIKVDTEGTDLEIVTGGSETFGRAAGVIIEATFFPSRYGEQAPVFEDIVARFSELGLMFRGHLSGSWNRGICHGIDAVFMRRNVAQRLAA